AEDGIRDKLVTGVQTCALPICCGVKTTPREKNTGCRDTRHLQAWSRFPRPGSFFQPGSIQFKVSPGLISPRSRTTIILMKYSLRSEERRVGKEWRSRMSRDDYR